MKPINLRTKYSDPKVKKNIFIENNSPTSVKYVKNVSSI